MEDALGKIGHHCTSRHMVVEVTIRTFVTWLNKMSVCYLYRGNKTQFCHNQVLWGNIMHLKHLMSSGYLPSPNRVFLPTLPVLSNRQPITLLHLIGKRPYNVLNTSLECW